MSWQFLKAKRFQKFGQLKVIDHYDRPGWLLCACACGNYRGVQEQKLLSGEITACASCTARMKFEKVSKAG